MILDLPCKKKDKMILALEKNKVKWNESKKKFWWLIFYQLQLLLFFVLFVFLLVYEI